MLPCIEEFRANLALSSDQKFRNDALGGCRLGQKTAEKCNLLFEWP